VRGQLSLPLHCIIKLYFNAVHFSEYSVFVYTPALMSITFFSAVALRCFDFSSHQRMILKYLKFNSEVWKGAVSIFSGQ
jgi:hypothetical protein